MVIAPALGTGLEVVLGLQWAVLQAPVDNSRSAWAARVRLDLSTDKKEIRPQVILVCHC